MTIIPFIAEMPNSATKPIAADTLNGIPVRTRANIPPTKAIGMALAASIVSVIEPKFKNSSMQMSARLSGTATASRSIASCSSRNPPTHSARGPAGHRAREPVDPLLQFAELPDPFETWSGGQRHLFSHLVLSLEHRAAEVP